MPFCICLPNFVQIGSSATELWRHIHLTRWQPLHRIILPVSVFVITLIWEGGSLRAYQISARYFNPRLRYYYFRFLKTIVRHVRILLLVPIFTFASPSACHSASAYQISSKAAIHDKVMTSYPFFKMAATASQCYFRFWFSWFCSYCKVEI